MRLITYNAGNASDQRLRTDIGLLVARDAVAIGLQEVGDRRHVIHGVPGYRTIQRPGAVHGHVALLIREDAHVHRSTLHQIGRRTYVGHNVAGARHDGWTAAKYILAAHITVEGERVTVATMHLVPSAAHSKAAAALLSEQAANAALWLEQQQHPTDLMGDCNASAHFTRLAPLRHAATPLSKPSHGRRAIDIHWITGQGVGTARALDGYSSDHRPVEAVIAWDVKHRHHHRPRRAQ